MGLPHSLDNLLNNPIWHALTADQAELAEGEGLARRYPHAIGPLAGLQAQSIQAYANLAPLSGKNADLGTKSDQLVLFLDEPPQLPAGWVLDVGGELTQMVLGKALPEWPLEFAHSAAFTPGLELAQHSARLPALERLSEADIPAMLALTQLCKPGPFRPQTYTLGLYLGIKVQGQLVAMAGERLDLPGYTEISAVCTHPDFQGKGFAQRLLVAVARHIQGRGKIPFLHTRPDNTGAIRVYEKLGFHQRRLLHLAVIRSI